MTEHKLHHVLKTLTSNSSSIKIRERVPYIYTYYTDAMVLVQIFFPNIYNFVVVFVCKKNTHTCRRA